MAITHEQVKQHIAKIEPAVENLLMALEKDVRRAHDGDGRPIPVHLTKWRVKSVDSAYLKTKRKSKASLEEITDYGGFRILCMFEQDILPVHRALLKILSERKYALTEFRVFNWHDEPSIAGMELEVKQLFPGEGTESKRDDKESGYRSLHYVVTQAVGGTNCSIEIQLRTLLQDAWAELEHAISYKHGSIHPHIRKSFSLLARDLETNDRLITHLRDINEKEQIGDAFSRKNFGPYEVFNYEEEMIPKLFRSNGELDGLRKAYESFAMAKPNGGSTPDWNNEARALYDKIMNMISMKDMQLPDVHYWVLAEAAFLDFCDGVFDGALKKYVELTQLSPEYYVPYFRMGEIDFINGHFERSLVSFDKCEELLGSKENLDKLNCYRVKVKLANVYWHMGSEYFWIALQKIKEAEAIAISHLDNFQGRVADKRKLANNLCWYQLEMFLLEQEKSARQKEAEEQAKAEAKSNNEFEQLVKRFVELEGYLDRDSSANMFDTAAWVSFKVFKRTGDRGYLEKARKYCMEGWSRKNEAIRSMTSTNMHSNHTREILSAPL